MARFGTFIYGDGTLYGPGDEGSGPVFPIENLSRVPWIFKDTVTDDEYEFAINPIDATVPSLTKSVTTQYTAAGIPINWEGRPTPQTMSFSGTILTEEHLNIMITWVQKSTQVNLSDDLGRKYWIYITSFSPSRQYSPQYPWRHEYSAEATVLSWA